VPPPPQLARQSRRALKQRKKKKKKRRRRAHALLPPLETLSRRLFLPPHALQLPSMALTLRLQRGVQRHVSKQRRQRQQQQQRGRSLWPSQYRCRWMKAMHDGEQQRPKQKRMLTAKEARKRQRRALPAAAVPQLKH
jgi:hypothetical protein